MSHHFCKCGTNSAGNNCKIPGYTLGFLNQTKSNHRLSKGKAKVSHTTKIEGVPVFYRPRRLASDKLKSTRAEFNYMLHLGVIHPFECQWASHLIMVRNENEGDWQQCMDHRSLNRQTVPDRCPIPHIQDFTNGSQDGHIYYNWLTMGISQYPSSSGRYP